MNWKSPASPKTLSPQQMASPSITKSKGRERRLLCSFMVGAVTSHIGKSNGIPLLRNIQLCPSTLQVMASPDSTVNPGQYLSSAPLEVGMGAFDGNFNYWLNDIVQVVKETKAPITCINSDKYPSNLEGNKKYNPSYKLKIMTGVGHFVMLEDPENFNCLLEETVQEFVLTPTQTANYHEIY